MGPEIVTMHRWDGLRAIVEKDSETYFKYLEKGATVICVGIAEKVEEGNGPETEDPMLTAEVIDKMTKRQLVALARKEFGVDLDRRKRLDQLKREVWTLVKERG